MQDQPSGDEGWQTRDEFDAELHHLPRTSAAEFRVAAWKLRSSESLYPRGSYWPRVGGRGFLAVVLALVPLTVPWALLTGSRLTAAEWLFALAAAVLSVLLGWWKKRSNDGIRRRLRRNGQLARMSREMDALVDRGVVPHTPPGWRDRVPAPLPMS